VKGEKGRAVRMRLVNMIIDAYGMTENSSAHTFGEDAWN